MTLLVRPTSKGPVALRFHGGYSRFGFSVAIGVFDKSGWMEEVAQWGPWDKNNKVIPSDEIQASLARAIAASVDLSLDEATELAEFGLSEWRAKGGEKEGKSETIKGLGLVTAIGGGVLLLIAVLIVIAAVVIMFLTKVA